MEKLLLKPEEAAALIGVGRSKMYAMLARGELAAVRVGKCLRIPPRALHEWVQSQRTSMPEAASRLSAVADH